MNLLVPFCQGLFIGDARLVEVTKLLHRVGRSLKIPVNSFVCKYSNHCILVGCAGKVEKRRFVTSAFYPLRTEMFSVSKL